MKKEMTLYEVDLSAIKPNIECLDELQGLEISINTCYWLGSVDINDRNRLESFIAYVKKMI